MDFLRKGWRERLGRLPRLIPVKYNCMQNDLQIAKISRKMHRMSHDWVIPFMIYILLVQIFLPYSQAYSESYQCGMRSTLDCPDEANNQRLCFVVESAQFLCTTNTTSRNLHTSVCWHTPAPSAHRANHVISSISALRLTLCAQFLKSQINRPLLI